MKPANKPNAQRDSELKTATQSLRPFIKKVLFFSVFTNFLAVMPMIYMLEVYERVVNSASYSTLAWETLLIIVILVMLESLEWVRNRLLKLAGLHFDRHMGERSFNAMFEANLRRLGGSNNQALNDLRSLREFTSSPAMLAFIDAPLALVYLLLIFWISPPMGWLAVVGAIVQIVLAIFNQRSTQPPLSAANKAAIEAQNYAANSLRNAQVIEAMGMQGNIHQRWMKRQQEFLALQATASDKAGNFSASARFVQLTQSSLLLGLGCWLMILGEFEGGGGLMIVGSSLGAKALAPLSQIIAQWKTVVSARDAWRRLDDLLLALPAREPGMPLPAPQGNLSVEALTAAAPGTANLILRGLQFAVPAGKALAIVGPSASGKTTLARLLTGIWPAHSGTVRLDGADVFTWNKDELGPHVGYLPQEVELFEGSIAENIARFGPVDMAQVEAAARAVGLHDIITALPEGYDSNIGDEGCFLSGGQRQRVGLARAIYGNPRFVVLDEPNSSLDEAGERALVQTILGLKACGTTVVVITHRTSILPAVDLMLLLVEGQAKAFGPRDEVLAALQRNAQAAVPQAPASTVQPSAA